LFKPKINDDLAASSKQNYK